MSSSGSQTSSRPPPKPKVLNPIDSRATLPARIIKSAHEIFRPYFCLTGQEQAARLVEVHVVRPAIERCEALLPSPGAAAAIADAVRACTVPRHADEQPSVVPEVGRPPI